MSKFYTLSKFSVELGLVARSRTTSFAKFSVLRLENCLTVREFHAHVLILRIGVDKAVDGSTPNIDLGE